MMDKVTNPYLVASTPSTKNIKFLLIVDIDHSVQWLWRFLLPTTEKWENLYMYTKTSWSYASWNKAFLIEGYEGSK